MLLFLLCCVFIIVSFLFYYNIYQPYLLLVYFVFSMPVLSFFPMYSLSFVAHFILVFFCCCIQSSALSCLCTVFICFSTHKRIQHVENLFLFTLYVVLWRIFLFRFSFINSFVYVFSAL